jgi:hypothetical protein
MENDTGSKCEHHRVPQQASLMCTGYQSVAYILSTLAVSYLECRYPPYIARRCMQIHPISLVFITPRYEETGSQTT